MEETCHCAPLNAGDDTSVLLTLEIPFLKSPQPKPKSRRLEVILQEQPLPKLTLKRRSPAYNGTEAVRQDHALRVCALRRPIRGLLQVPRMKSYSSVFRIDGSGSNMIGQKQQLRYDSCE